MSTSLNEEKLKLIELRANGLSFDKCAKELNKAKSTLIDWNKELEDHISNLKAEKLEALYEEFYISKEARIRKLATIQMNIKKELESRDLADVPTDKLIDIYLKVDSKLESEHIEPNFLDSKTIGEKDFFRFT